MASLVESGKYGVINTTDTSTNGFYVILFTSGAYTLQENTIIDGQILIAGELVVNAKYICSMQVDTNWYWNQQPSHHYTHQFLFHTQFCLVDLFPLICNRIHNHSKI